MTGEFSVPLPRALAPAGKGVDQVYWLQNGGAQACQCLSWLIRGAKTTYVIPKPERLGLITRPIVGLLAVGRDRIKQCLTISAASKACAQSQTKYRNRDATRFWH